MGLDARIPLMAQGMNLEPRSNALMRAAQLQGTQDTNALRQMQMQQMQQAAQQTMMERQAAAQREQSMMGYLQSMSGQAGPPQPFNPAEAAQRLGIDGAKKLQELMASSANMGRAKVARTVEIAGPDGKPMTVQLDEFGSMVGNQMPKPVEMRMANTGGAQTPYNPYAQTAPIPMTMAPGEAERISIARRQAGASEAQASAARDGVNLQRDLAIREKELKVKELEDKARERDGMRTSSVATMADSIGVIDKALNHPGRSTATGLTGQIDPRNYIAGTDARNFQIVADQIGGKAFLQAFESLKGGGQITETEGKKATDAIARLNRAQSDAEYEQALRDFRGVIASAYKRSTGKDYVSPGANVNTDIGVPPVTKFNDAGKEQRYQEWKRSQGGKQ